MSLRAQKQVVESTTMTLIFIATLVLLASTGLADSLGWKMALRGRVVFPEGPRTPVECDGVLEVLLQDTSMADAPAQTVARYLGKAIEFPIHFALKYDPEEVLPGRSYSLRISIRNKKNELLYTNDAHLGVTPVGEERTTFIDTPVILVKRVARKTQWPELIGQTGEEAVRVIKEETGFSNIPIILQGSPVTLDYRTNRVRVVVDQAGNVVSMPSVS